MRLQVFLVVMVTLATTAVRESSAASTLVTTGTDGAINCDGLRCPIGDGIKCMVSADTMNGKSTVTRQCLNPAGQVISQSAYNMETPGMTFGRQSSTAVLYTKS